MPDLGYNSELPEMRNGSTFHSVHQFDYNGVTYHDGDRVIFNISDDSPMFEGRLFVSGTEVYIANNDMSGAGDSPFTEYCYSWVIGIIQGNALTPTDVGIMELVSATTTAKPKAKRIKRVRTGILKSKTQAEALKEAIKFIKTCPYKGTAIKVEMEGNLRRDADKWSDDTCNYFILDQVSKTTRERLVYSQFYWDGSVDSEFTFTVPINHPEDVIEFMHAWNALVKEIGNGCDVRGAGLHTCILNSEDRDYPHGNRMNLAYEANFTNAMTSLLPALYCLASCDYRSRSLDFRHAKIGSNKYNAVSSRDHTCFEYRCFETCYNYPERFYDYICVIAQTLQFYSETPLLPHFAGKIGKLGMPSGHGVSRFYYTYEHARALNLGLEILKPPYKTAQQIKKERNIRLPLIKLEREVKSLETQWHTEYKTAAEVQRKRRGDYIKSIKMRYEQQLTEHLDRLRRYYLMDRTNVNREQIKMIKLYIKGETAEALEILKKSNSYSEYRKNQIGSAPPPPELSIKKYVDSKKQSYLCSGASEIITV